MKSQFALISKVKAANFRSHCLARADKHGIERTNVPTSSEIKDWLLMHNRINKKAVCWNLSF